MAKEQQFEVFSGNDAILRLTIMDEETNDVLDLTGAQELIFAVARKAPRAGYSETPVLEKTLAAGVSLVTPAEGRANVTLSRTELEPLSGYYYYEVALTDVVGLRSTVLFGRMHVVENLITD